MLGNTSLLLYRMEASSTRRPSPPAPCEECTRNASCKSQGRRMLLAMQHSAWPRVALHVHAHIEAPGTSIASIVVTVTNGNPEWTHT